MASPLKSLIACGTKLWLDSIDPDLVVRNRAWGATGATSNPDHPVGPDQDRPLRREARTVDARAVGRRHDRLANDRRAGARGPGSLFAGLAIDRRQRRLRQFRTRSAVGRSRRAVRRTPSACSRYVELGKQWSAGHKNRMIKVPATPAGLEALEGLAAAGVTLNVTLIFTSRQYQAARDAVWRGRQQLRQAGTLQKRLQHFRLARRRLHRAARPRIVAGRARPGGHRRSETDLAREPASSGSDKKLPLAQEMIFASTGTKKPSDPPTKYVAAFAGSDIETNPPATNDAVEKSGLTFTRQVDQAAAATRCWPTSTRR